MYSKNLKPLLVCEAIAPSFILVGCSPSDHSIIGKMSLALSEILTTSRQKQFNLLAIIVLYTIDRMKFGCFVTHNTPKLH